MTFGQGSFLGLGEFLEEIVAERLVLALVTAGE